MNYGLPGFAGETIMIQRRLRRESDSLRHFCALQK